MRENGTTISLAAVGALAVGFVAYLLWSRKRAA
jgi:LPXTG-motif cell wall-anchored protein